MTKQIKLHLCGRIYLLVVLLFFCHFSNTNAQTGIDLAKQSGYRTINSAAIAGNRIGENPERKIYVHLPDSYQKNHNKQFPVMYFLTGYGQSVEDWVDGYLSFLETADSLMQNDAVKEMIIVIISGKNRLDGSFYVNSPVTGNWEDFVVKEVRHFIDNEYRTTKKAKGRAIAGHSMGGFGALNIAMKYPDVYGCVYAHCAGILAPEDIKQSILYKKENIVKFIGAEEQMKLLSANLALNYYDSLTFAFSQNMYANWEQMFLLAYSSAFAPLPERAPFCTTPFDTAMNVVNYKVLTEWENGFGNISEKVRKHKKQLKSLKGIGLMYGKTDYFAWISTGTKHLSDELKKHSVEHEIFGVEGGHQENITGRFGIYVLPYVSSKFK